MIRRPMKVLLAVSLAWPPSDGFTFGVWLQAMYATKYSSRSHAASSSGTARDAPPLLLLGSGRRSSGAPDPLAGPDCGWRHVALFFVLALGTNYAYIAALEYIPASLNTAVFSTSPVLTLALSVQFLSEPVTAPRAKWASVMLSIVGVAMICEPWASLSPERPLGALASAALDKPGGIDRPIGCALSLAAAAGSASCEYSSGRSATAVV